MIRQRKAKSIAAVTLAIVSLMATAAACRAEIVEWLPANNPIYRQLDLLRTEGLIDTTVSFEMRPMSRLDIARLVAHARRRNPDKLDHPGLVTLSQNFSRELIVLGFDPVPGYTKPLIEVPRRQPGQGLATKDTTARFRLIPYLDITYGKPPFGVGRFGDRSRIGARLGLELGNFFLYQDLYLGYFEGAQKFADPLISGEDLIVYTEDTYLSAHTRWVDFTLGRGRHALGPGRDGNLLWSSTAGPMTYFRWNFDTFGGKFRGNFLHSDVDASDGARMAAHRLDLNLIPSLTLGAHEAARYSSSHWEPLYVFGLIPYTFVQRMLQQDQSDSSTTSVRNNVILGVDLTWRITPGTSVYSEFILDNYNLEESGNPTRIGWQVGWLGARSWGERRFRWRAEFDRVYRYVYTTFYGENFVHLDMPIGYPLGPDSRNIFLNAGYDFNSSWGVTLKGARVDEGEGNLGEYFDPNGPPASGSEFAGVVQTLWPLSAEVSWIPRDGVVVEGQAAYAWRQNANHMNGVDDNDWGAAITVFLRH